MTSPLVERVARALQAECYAVFTANWNNDVAARFARAAIEAMREPTEGMLAAGDKSADFDGDCIADIWQAMISAALKEG